MTANPPLAVLLYQKRSNGQVTAFLFFLVLLEQGYACKPVIIRDADGARHTDRNPDHKRSGLKSWIIAVGVKPFILYFPDRLLTPVIFFVVALHDQSESTISMNPHTFSLINGRSIFHYLRLPQLAVDTDVTRGSQSIFSDTS